MGGLVLYRQRVRAGAWDDVIEAAWQRYVEGGRESLANAWTDELTDRILARYDGKIRALFGRAGVEVGEGETINKAWLLQRLTDSLGVPVEDITPEAIMGAVDRGLAARLSEVLRVPVSTVMDMERLKADVREGVILALQDGRAADLIYDTALAAARRWATWQRHGDDLDPKTVQNNQAQKKYRKTHRLQWV